MYGVILYMLRMKRDNMQNLSYKHVFSKSILVENNVDPDQTASTEASCSGSTVLPKRIQSVKHDKVKFLQAYCLSPSTCINRLADPH